MGKVEAGTGGTGHTQNVELYHLLVSACGIEGFTQVGPRVSWLCSCQPQCVGTYGTAAPAPEAPGPQATPHPQSFQHAQPCPRFEQLRLPAEP